MPTIPSTLETLLHHPLSTVVRESSCVGRCLRNWKIIFAVILFVEGLVFGHVVLLLRGLTTKSKRTFQLITHFGHALSAGVFFATGMMHILPEAIALLSGKGHGAHGEGSTGKGDGHDEHDHDSESPLTEGSNGGEDHDEGDGHDDHEHGEDNENKDSHQDGDDDHEDGEDNENEDSHQDGDDDHDHGESHDNEDNHDDGHDDHDDHGEEHSEHVNRQGLTSVTHQDSHSDSHEISFPWAFLVVVLGFYFFFFIEKILLPKIFGDVHHHGPPLEKHSTLAQPDADASSNDVNDPATGNASTPLAKTQDIESSQSQDPSDSLSIDATVETRFLSSAFAICVIQVLGISAHSLFESMVLGLSGDFSTVLNVFIAVVSHRWATAAAIALTCTAKLSYKLFIVIFLLFSAMVPIGIGIGAGLNKVSDNARGVLFALSAATFLYIGIFETMSEEFVLHRRMLFRKFLFTLSGAAIIIVITAILVALNIHG